MSTLNLGILAHVDAGKTSLTERLLHTAGVIDEIGSVDSGSTQTDSLELERRRGITIKSAVVSFAVGGVTVNLIDTPGHPDFIAEVERVLSVLDGAVLVVSAVEGVQAQTRVLMRTLQRLRIPTLIFVNKIDRAGARQDGVLAEIAARLTAAIVADGAGGRPGYPGRVGVGRRARCRGPRRARRRVAGRVRQRRSARPPLHDVLRERTAQAALHPVFFGSAITGAGVDELIDGITDLLPPAPARGGGGPVSGTVFKVERGPAGEKIAYVRMFRGAVRVRDRLGRRQDDRDPGVLRWDDGVAGPRGGAGRSRPCAVWPESGSVTRSASRHAGERASLRAAEPGDGGGAVPAPPTAVPLHAALVQLAEQDPLIDLRQDDVRQEVSVSLYGEVQKEVIQATLADVYGLDVTFLETTTICIERPAGVGAAFELIGVEPNPFLAQVGLRVEPSPPGSGVRFGLEVELGSMPYAFFKAVEETVPQVLAEGLHGWQVTDCSVVMTHSGYYARQSHAHGTFDKSMSSTAGDFRLLTPLVLMEALRRAGTRVLEPIHAVRLEVPADTVSAVLPVLARLGGVPLATSAVVRCRWWTVRSRRRGCMTCSSSCRR